MREPYNASTQTNRLIDFERAIILVAGPDWLTGCFLFDHTRLSVCVFERAHAKWPTARPTLVNRHRSLFAGQCSAFCSIPVVVVLSSIATYPNKNWRLRRYNVVSGLSF